MKKVSITLLASMIVVSGYAGFPVPASSNANDAARKSEMENADQKVMDRLRMDVEIDTEKVQGFYSTADFITLHPWSGTNGVVHPSVYVFDKPWNGYTYWMVYTPYPNTDATYEAPSIEASLDGHTWEVPAGLTNPIIPPPWPSQTDPFITYDKEQDILQVVYRSSYAGLYEALKYTYSTNGVDWTTPSYILIDSEISTAHSILCPMIVKEVDGTYKMWTIDNIPAQNVMELRTASDITGPWVFQTNCTFDVVRDYWHTCIRKVGNKYLALINTNPSQASYFGYSNDGINWTMSTNDVTTGPDVGSNYKSSFWPVYSNGKFALRTWLGHTAYKAAVSYYTPADYQEWEIADMIINFDYDFDKDEISNGYLSEIQLSRDGLEDRYAFYDTFTRADTNAVTGSGEYGGSWTATAFTITNHVMWSGGSYQARVDLGITNASIRAQFFDKNDGVIDNAYLVGRYTGSSETYKFGKWAAGNILLTSHVPGTPTSTNRVLDYAVAEKELVDGDWLELRIEGNHLQGYKNGELICEAWDDQNDHTTATKWGVAANTAGQGFDNITITPIE